MQLVLGGGCFEVQLAKMLEAKAETHEGIEQAAYLAFADAVKSIPLALAENSGANAMRYGLSTFNRDRSIPYFIVFFYSSALVLLQSKHSQGEVQTGIEGTSGCFINAYDASTINRKLDFLHWK